MKRKFFLLLLLMFFWILLSTKLTLLIIIEGFIVSAGIILFLEYISIGHFNIFEGIKITQLITFICIVLVEIFKSSMIHIVKIIKNTSYPTVFNVNLRGNEKNINILIANAITLTPGTISLKVYEQRIKVLALVSSEKEVDSMKNTITKRFENSLR